MIERLGTRMLSRFVPTVTASAGWCSCEPNSWWCCKPDPVDKTNYCYCYSGNGTCYIKRGYTITCRR